MGKKDIFIDNNIAKNFTNPADTAYKDLIQWLKEYGYLCVSSGILTEYHRSNIGNFGNSAITTIIDILIRKNRLINIKNNQIKEYQNSKVYRQKENQLQSNREDREHIAVVMLSDRKKALTLDKKFEEDLSLFGADVANKPFYSFYT